MPWYSLKFRIAGTIFLLETVMMGAVLWQTSSLSQEASRRQLAATEQVVLNLLEELAHLALYTEEYDELQFYIERIVTDPHVLRVWVLDLRDTIMVSSTPNDLGQTLPPLHNSKEHSWTVRKLEKKGQVLGKLAVEFSHTELIAATGMIRDTGLTIALVGITLIALVGTGLGYLLTRRLDDLSRTAQSWADGEWQARAQTQGHDEVATLSQAFNLMAESIQRHLAKIRQSTEMLQIANEELEHKVLRRTHALRQAKELAESTNVELSHKTAQLERSLQQLQATQDQLVQAEKMASLGGLVAGVAHEINTPLGSGITVSSLLLEQIESNTKLFQNQQLKKSHLKAFFKSSHDCSRIILSSLERAAKLVSTFKETAVDRASEAKSQFNVATLFEENLSPLRPELASRQLDWQLQCPAALQVIGYPHALAKVFNGLLNNTLAHAFAPGQPGCIQMQVALQENCLHLRYSDNGRGIAEAHRERIFDPFFTTARGNGHLGLGLHIIYNIVSHQCQGKIYFEPEACFHVELPVER